MALDKVTGFIMFIYMLEYLMQPINYINHSQTSSAMSFSSESSSRRTSLSSSRPEFRPIHSEIIRRNLVTEFQEASSLPGNVLIYRSKEEAGKVFGDCLASRSWEEEKVEEDLSVCGRVEVGRKTKKCKRKKSKCSEVPDLMFCIDM